MADGDDCKCCACCIGYCSCGADWTSQEVYDLRNKVSQLQAEVKRLTDENSEMKEVDTALRQVIRETEQELVIAKESRQITEACSVIIAKDADCIKAERDAV